MSHELMKLKRILPTINGELPFSNASLLTLGLR